MTEVRTPVYPIRLEKKCECGGMFKYTGQSVMSLVDKTYWHRCDAESCQKMEKFPVLYPRIEYEDAPVPVRKQEVLSLRLGVSYVTQSLRVVKIDSFSAAPADDTLTFFDCSGRAYKSDGTNIERYVPDANGVKFIADDIAGEMNEFIVKLLSDPNNAITTL